MAQANQNIMESNPVVKPVFQVILLAWLIPGAGHLYIGRVWKGVLFFVCLTFTFIFGLMLQGVIFIPGGEDTQTLLISLFGTIGDFGVGLYYILCLFFYHLEGEITYQYYEIGMLFTLVAGVFNYLIIVDALDICKGRKV
ncbi:DUF6677 family protein [candidate division CSSED10-310 bacterium]|uniref:DUF6677 family protein n=1 Tax=candidate division CSSED10-310 bacterium TaxID=2855610 RepID=A0ABV6YVP8_UNCC1